MSGLGSPCALQTPRGVGPRSGIISVRCHSKVEEIQSWDVPLARGGP